MNLPGYDNWKTATPHEPPTCQNCGACMEEEYTNTAPPSLVCPECEEEEDDD